MEREGFLELPVVQGVQKMGTIGYGLPRRRNDNLSNVRRHDREELSRHRV